MVTRYHLDTDVLVHALGRRGPARDRVTALAREGVRVEMSAVAWYEFCRGPRTPEQLAAALDTLSEDPIARFDAMVAEESADVFRRLGSPRRRAQDIAIAVTARLAGATLLTRNARDFAGIDGLNLEAVVDSVAEPIEPGARRRAFSRRRR